LAVALFEAPGVPEQAAGADLIVANLPYVAEGEWASLPPEITRYEPRDALVSGRDGLDAIRGLVAGRGGRRSPSEPRSLRSLAKRSSGEHRPPRPTIALEHAPAQAAAVRSLVVDPETLRDLAGRERVTVGRVE
jgi:release factor glutamine methyltransferase